MVLEQDPPTPLDKIPPDKIPHEQDTPDKTPRPPEKILPWTRSPWTRSARARSPRTRCPRKDPPMDTPGQDPPWTRYLRAKSSLGQDLPRIRQLHNRQLLSEQDADFILLSATCGLLFKLYHKSWIYIRLSHTQLDLYTT